LLHAQDDRHHSTTTCDTAAHRATAPLQGRGRQLREQAPSLTPPLAEAYRRRAAEFDSRRGSKPWGTRPSTESAICARRSLTEPCHRTLGEPDRAGALQRRLGGAVTLADSRSAASRERDRSTAMCDVQSRQNAVRSCRNASPRTPSTSAPKTSGRNQVCCSGVLS
jgi:hypothetical protein